MSVAITSEHGTLNYGELNERAEQIGRFLRSRGVRQGTYVSLCMRRSTELILGMLGVLRAGGAYVPIDPGYPKERLRFILDEVDSPIVLASAETVALLPETGAAVICIDRDWSSIESVKDEFKGEQSGAGGADPACVIFTSGSTGNPKGVIVPHDGIVDLVVNTNYIDLGPSDRVAHVSNVGFDAASFEIWGALLNGAQLVIIPGWISSEPRELAAELRRHDISVLLLTTALFELLAAWDGVVFGGIRRLLVGGDVVNPQWMRRVLTSGQPPERLLHVYGPTECTTLATAYLVTSVPEDAVRVPIGWPVSKTTAYVLDAECKPVPSGTSGELCLGGPRLAKGYLNRPDLTREKFTHVQFGDGLSERIYRTGDLVRCLPDSSIDFLGRIDRQLKIRGYRVEPGEVESRLNAHPSIASSVVMARRDPSRQASLVAFFLVHENQPAPSAAELSAHLSVNLPDYMLPSTFVRQAEWPLSAHGKVDHDALLAGLQGDGNRDETASSSPAEQTVRELCRKVIGASFLSLDESLIAHGLHSLSAANLAWMIEEEFKVRLKLSEILNDPSIAGILALLEKRSRGDGETVDPRLEVRTERPPRIPLSFPQEQIWFLEKLHPHLNSYRFQSLLHCRGALDIGALEATLNQIVSRHEILRTVFLGEDHMPRQEIRPHVPFRLPLEDLRDQPADARRRQLDLLIHDELRRPFDSAAGPLIRWRLFQVNDDEFKLLHTEHHFLHDGWGYGIFLGELYAIYKARSEKEDLAWHSSPMQFADFALWQREVMASGAWDKQLAFWKEELAGCPPPPPLPSDRRMSVSRSFEGRQIRRPFPQAVWEGLGEMCSRHGVTRFAWLHAAFQLFIHRYTGAEDFCVGSGFANRRDPRLRGMLGMVINTLPIRARFEGVNSFRELAQRASQALRRASDNQELPFERVVQEINPHREANANPFFNTCIGAYEDAFPHFQSDRLEITSEDALACGQVKFDLMALIVPSPRGSGENSSAKPRAPLVLWEFSTELFDVSTGQRMLDHFLRLVESSVRQPDAPLGRLPLMSRDEEELVLRFGQGPSSPLDDSRVDTVFDRVARSVPNAVAVEWEGGTLSYDELNQRATALAGYLRANGIANGVRVALCMDRCAEMIIGMLGILKAGGTYVPFDPTYPSERLEFMQKDAQVALILSIERFAERVASVGTKVILFDRDQGLFESSPEEEFSDSGASNDLAYVIFTSGSTGQPKGVIVPHQAIVRLVIKTNYVSLGPEDCLGHLSNVCFDAATFEIWGALLNGGRILVIPKSTALEPRQLAAELERGKVTTVFLTTALFNEMAAEDAGIFKSIKQVLFGGEAADAHWVKRVLRGGHAPERLLNMYGPTECTTFATYFPVENLEEGATSVPIGRAISHTTTHVLDQYGNHVPIGVPGELYLGGLGVAAGYLNRPDLTREPFVPDRWSEDEHDRLYRTGDIVKYLPDGNIEFIRRADSQTKIRGFRIEPGEIEAALKAHPEVENAVVVAREEKSGQRQLVGYVVARDDNIRSTWRSYLEEKLPFYMIPSRMVRVQELPTTPSGKIDRLALPEPERQVERDLVALSPFEEMTAAVWSDVLEVGAIAPHESFFELGGHSLLATRVVSQLRSRFGVEIPLRAVFDNPTLAEMGRFLAKLHKEESNPSEPSKDVLREEALL